MNHSLDKIWKFYTSNRKWKIFLFDIYNDWNSIFWIYDVSYISKGYSMINSDSYNMTQTLKTLHIDYITSNLIKFRLKIENLFQTEVDQSTKPNGQPFD